MRFDLHTLLHDSRRHSRGFALLALLAICLQLTAMGIGNLHAQERLTQGQSPSETITLQICTPAGMSSVSVEGEPHPAHGDLPDMGAHCPFCLFQAGVSLPVVAFSFPPPEPATTVFLPANAAGFQPAAPDSRHAPKHAPPVSFA
jgi:hypothetical protein